MPAPDWNYEPDSWTPEPAAWTPGEVQLITERAWGLYQQGAWSHAAVLWEGLLAIDPESRYVRKALALTRRRMGLDQDGWEVWNRMVAVNPHDLDALAGRCEASVHLGMRDAARSDLEALEAAGAPQARRLRLILYATARP
jgi:hypothetical protein